jgi:hypothetical protein
MPTFDRYILLRPLDEMESFGHYATTTETSRVGLRRRRLNYQSKVDTGLFEEVLLCMPRGVAQRLQRLWNQGYISEADEARSY